MTLLDHRGRPIRRQPLLVRGRYDAAQVTEDTSRHWREADILSARAANSPDVRLKLRSRARYEIANNCYAAGIVSTIANDLIGTGPRLQMLSDNDNVNREYEISFAAWAAEVQLAQKLRTLCRAKIGDGEGFAVIAMNPRLRTSVKLDVRLYEAEQFATPYQQPLDVLAVDGLRLDSDGNIIEYHLLRSHPGDLMSYPGTMQFDVLSPDRVIHWFRADRPGQYRGIPEITPALTLFAQLRRYTLAVIAAAETAADFAAVLQSQLPPDSDGVGGEPFEAIPIERRMMVTLPAGTTLGQLRAEQPTTTYQQFKAEIINEIARCLNVPYNVAAGNSSSYNYSSGRLDHQVYYRNIEVDRAHLESVALDPILLAWLNEVRLRNGLDPTSVPHRWLWPGLSHVDPEKEANATVTLLVNGLTTFSDECARQGIDAEAQVARMAADRQLFERYGEPIPWAASKPAPTAGNGSSTNGQQQSDQGGVAAGAGARAVIAGRNGHV